MNKFSVQPYHWTDGLWELGSVQQVIATDAIAAAMAVVGHPVTNAGPTELLAARVWQFGEARRPPDVLHFWRPMGG